MSQRVLFEIRQLSSGLSGISFLHGELCQVIIMPFIIMMPFISSLWQTWCGASCEDWNIPIFPVS